MCGEHDSLLSSVQGKSDPCFDGAMPKSRPHVALVYFLPSPQRTGHKTTEGRIWWEVVVCLVLANSNQHTTPTMLDTLYTSVTYFLCFLPPNIEKEKLQAKLDTKVRTGRRKITRNLEITIINE